MYPFWYLFQSIKAEFNAALTIEDYFLFLKSFEQMPSGSIKNYTQFSKFCKLFWLKDPKNEFAFDMLFKVYQNQMIEELNKIIASSNIQPEKEDKEQHSKENKSKTDTVVPDTRNDVNPNVTSDSSIQNQKVVKTKQESQPNFQIEDIELLIADGEGQGQEKTDYEFQHFFFMGDDFIMPFEKRYIAQRMRRMVETKDKVEGEELNIPAILNDFARDQYIHEIHRLDEDFSNIKVVLFTDRMGSMLAYEHIEQHLAETFQIIPGIELEYYFFANLPPTSKDREHFLLTSALEVNQNINSKDHKWTRNTWFFILSDAGAHSGAVSGGRIKATIKFWEYLKAVSSHVFWLNPVPNEYMNDCTAKRLQMMIPMYGVEQPELKRLFTKA